MSLAFGINIAGAVIGQYASYRQSRAAIKQHNRNQAITKKLAMQALGITYNSILDKSQQVQREASRQAFAVKAQAVAAKGDLMAQAAHRGVAGTRGHLAIKQATLGEADRQMAELSADLKMSQDALIKRAEMEERRVVSQLITGAPDMPSAFDPLVSGLRLGASIGDAWIKDRQFQTQREDAIASG